MDGSYVLLRLCIKHYATVALLVASPLQLVPEHVSALDEKRPDDAHTSQERYTPEVRYNPLVIDSLTFSSFHLTNSKRQNLQRVSVVPAIYSPLYATLLARYAAASPFSVSFGSLATLPITTAAAKSPRFSNPFCCAPSARTMVALVALSIDWSDSVSRV